MKVALFTDISPKDSCEGEGVFTTKLAMLRDVKKKGQKKPHLEELLFREEIPGERELG